MYEPVVQAGGITGLAEGGVDEVGLVRREHAARDGDGCNGRDVGFGRSPDHDPLTMLLRVSIFVP
jgi:hypothetical protein